MMKAISLLSILLLAGAAYADPSVWEQLESGTSTASVWEQEESGNAHTVEATITNVQLDGLRVSFKQDGEPEKTYAICTQDRAINGKFYTEADRAMAIGLRVQPLKEAKKSHQKIKIGIKGPWSPCVFPIDV